MSADRLADMQTQKSCEIDGESRDFSGRQAIVRGPRGCPACACGRIFRSYLKPHDACPHCGQDWPHQRSDDLPAYIAILLVGRLLAPIIIAVELASDLLKGVQMVPWPSLATVLILLLVGPAKELRFVASSAFRRNIKLAV